ncbi:hypothetical protein U6A24_00605 [Aquimarina gracilis]|uniref:DUF4468 domain-containing protein n=1 Tax=Aquimarina gracilis TaxID=874422 RepID=A0ABU5ZP74_9FLAO|nr:hypothetical protein [Aquimarina gracilis]MEB3343935.1 hypothetical protein [Aquimarina gracilis]
MKYILLTLLFYYPPINAQNCEGFLQGTFEMKYEYGTVMIERMGNWQLEKSDTYGIVYLNKIRMIDDCKYELSYYKVLKLGNLPEPDMTKKAITKIINVEGSNYYFESSITGTNASIGGVFVKKSDEVSDDFKKLIAKEQVVD